MKSRISSPTIALGVLLTAGGVSSVAHAQDTNQTTTTTTTVQESMPTPVGGTPYPTYSTQPNLGEQKTVFVHPNAALLTSGAITLAASYTPTAIVAIGSDHDGDDWLFVPVIGPWIDLATRGCDTGQVANCGTTGFERTALITSGIVQGLGLIQLGASFAVPQRHLTTAAADKPTLHVTPGAVGRGQGIVAFGTF